MTYERVSPTAVMVAHRRTVTDIPYSREIFRTLQALQGEGLTEDMRTLEIAPQIEARYKRISNLVASSQGRQILELAAGLSPRGLNTTNGGTIDYTELDLPGILDVKRTIVGKLLEKPRINLHFAEGDATDFVSIQRAVTHLDKTQPITVINEGLLRYLAFSEKAKVARNVHALLKEFGGVWITPDITLRQLVQAENTFTDDKIDKVHEHIGTNIDETRFESADEAQRFFEDLGFTVERHRFMEVINQLTSPIVLGQTPEQVRDLIQDAEVFVMRVAST